MNCWIVEFFKLLKFNLIVIFYLFKDIAGLYLWEGENILEKFRYSEYIIIEFLNVYLRILFSIFSKETLYLSNQHRFFSCELVTGGDSPGAISKRNNERVGIVLKSAAE